MMNAPEPAHTLVIEKRIAHSPGKIWRALTEASLLEAWLMANDFLPIKGHKFTLRSQPMPQWDGRIECEVLILEPQRQLSYRWNALGLNTVVTWTLLPDDGGTLVRMQHAGFRSEGDANYKGASYGWQKFLAGLERILAGLDSP